MAGLLDPPLVVIVGFERGEELVAQPTGGRDAITADHEGTTRMQ